MDVKQNGDYLHINNNQNVVTEKNSTTEIVSSLADSVHFNPRAH